MVDKVPLIRVSGSSWRDLGRQHGAALKDRIHASASFYLGFFQDKWHFTEDEIEEQCRGYAEAIRSFNGDYTEEIEGIAEAAQLPAWKVYALNCRTELLNWKKSVTEAAAPQARPEDPVDVDSSSSVVGGECTALCNASAGLLAQNWDWDVRLEDLVVVLLMDKPDGSQIMMLTEPGVIGKIGMNSAGVGVTLQLLHCPCPRAPPGTTVAARQPTEDSHGIPIHILLRTVLDSHSATEAFTKLRGLPQGKRNTASCIIMADKGGNCHTLEFARGAMDDIKCLPATDKRACRPFPHCTPIHTNHYLGCGLECQTTGSETSYARFDTMERLLQELSGPPMLEDIKRVLADRSNAELPIQRPYKHDKKYGLMGGTVATVILELQKGVFHVTRGNPYEHPLEAISAPWAA
ncbi:unnamed protein product [Vitrella brassicaformis CCMP3155]|uniref:Peptidase C45 hydrolase domain-containing protein n=2 Tax=Vitrella brassicaformis TaxID=1169539 RepID=A0A0G4GEC8_VITBC|nr:unnamed protein product [Vitrella brassicaformis CCMP3155]|mmetsp:Transcript_9344/g.22898  ORF Transcript_9344/g.22898 Transcript_9344/m.22898 type:complete len:406 (+) Transcript_9344:95-1312(+)|eukprot:CEM27687.1 unnamed protein product [Vitrella brassicaformis CCMP3155]